MKKTVCPINDILNFHKTVMPSGKALKYALEQISEIPFSTIAPQHGSIISDQQVIRYVFEQLINLSDVGIDGLIDDNYRFNFNKFRKRLN
jgi:flavorubredoxin